MEGFAKESSHENRQRIGKRALYLCCSVSLSFVDEEVYDVMYRHDVTSYDVTSNDVSVERHSDFELDPRLVLVFKPVLAILSSISCLSL